jgi:lysophospholipase L1-like esterase
MRMKRVFFLASLVLFLIGSASEAQDLDRFQDEVLKISTNQFSRDPSKTLCVFTGSSSIRLWADLQTSFPDVQTMNNGFGGSTMEELLHFSDELIFRFNPEKIFIYEGDNDLELGQSVDRIIMATEILLAKIDAQLPKAEVIIIAAKPSIARWENHAAYEELNRSYRKLTRMQRNVKFADVWQPMLGTDGLPLSDIFIEDNLHMNAKGYQIWKEVLQKFVN